MRLILSLMMVCLVVQATAGAGQGRRQLTITEVIDSGTAVFLSDGSGWEVRNENRPKVAKWPGRAAVSVYRTDDREWPFRLVVRKPVADIVSAKRLVKVR